MAKEEWIGKIVKFKSGKMGIVLSTQDVGETIFLSVLISGQGIINIRSEDVEAI